MSNSLLTQYDPGEIILNANGIDLAGFAAGSFIKVLRTVDAFGMSVGADGETTRVKSQNMSGSISATFVQGSPSNDVLSALATQDEISSNAVFPILLKDANGTTIASGAKCWIKKKAEVTFAVESESREWTFDIAQLVLTVGGATAL